MTSLLIGGNGKQPVTMDMRMANRHGLIAGATGTGKTVSLQVLAEQFSAAGVPVFLPDVKGDLSGLASAGTPHPKITERLQYIGLEEPGFSAAPVVFWDLHGTLGHPLRTTISEIGPLLLANLLELNETQTGVIYAVFKIADDQGWLLLDLDDLNTMLQFAADNASSLQSTYGNISAASIGAIRRRLLVLEEQGLRLFLGEPALQISDLMRCDSQGQGFINILDVSRLLHQSPRLYATMLLWLLSELFEDLPETGDADKPRLVMFLDEAHLLFNGASPVLVDKIEQVVRLIRSKGVGVFFVTQSPLDIPERVLGQLGLKIQHALRVFTPKDRRAVAAIADNFRENPDFKTVEVLPELGVGEALVSTLDDKGRPTPVEKTLIRPPRSRIGAITQSERTMQLQQSPHKGRFDQIINRDSAHEILAERARAQMQKPVEPVPKKSRGRSRQSVGEAFVKSITRTIGSQLGRQIARGILGSIFKK